jgi:hypothetical protein
MMDITKSLFLAIRKKLGKALSKSVRVSVVGVQSADGANDIHKEMCKKADEVRSSSITPIGELPEPLPPKPKENGKSEGGKQGRGE